MPFAVAEPPPKPKAPLTERSFRRHVSAGRQLLADTAKPLRLARKYTDNDKAPTDAQARKVLAKLVIDGRDELRLLADGLADERIPVDRWYRLTRDNVIARHVAAALATSGGMRLPAAEAASLRGRINEQLGYLDRFRAEVKSGDQLLGDGSAHRATLYADAAWGTGINAGLDRAVAGGARRARRVKSSGDSCPTCVAEAAAGWRPINRVARIGDSECGPNCHCRIEIEGAAKATRRIAAAVPEAVPGTTATPIRSVRDEAIARAKAANVAIITKGSAYFERRYPVPVAEQPWAEYHSGDDAIRLNEKHPYWSDPGAWMRRFGGRKWLATSERDHVIEHEIGHALHKRAAGGLRYSRATNDRHTPGRAEVAGRVSGYARTNPAEFVAEAYAGLRQGREYDDEVMDYFRALGGALP